MQSYDNLALTGIFAPVVLEDLKIQQKYNDHARIWIKGMVSFGMQDKLLLKALEGEEIGVEITGEEKSESLFYGIIEKATISHRSNVYHITIEGISRSKLLDIEKENKSFQNIEQSYDSIIQNRMENIDGQYINEDKRKDEPIARFTLQYLETRWEFIKRLVSRHNEGLIPDIKSKTLSYWIGMPSGRKTHKVEKTPCESIRMPRPVRVNLDNRRIEDSTENDFFAYKLLDRLEVYAIGDKVSFQGLTLRITEIESQLDSRDAVLRHNYTCIQETGCKQPLIYNEKIQGLSLEGNTIDRRKDFAKLHLFTIDQKQDVDTASWFRHCTYYTAGGDGGWCAMPEPMDQLSLHFPTIEENDCFLLDSTQVPYSSSIYPNVNAVSKAGMNPYSPQSGTDKTQKTIVDSKFVIAPKGQNMILENDMIRFSSQEATSTLSLFTAHADATGTTLGIQLLTEGDLKLDRGDDTVKNIRFGVPNTGNSSTPSQEVFFSSDKDVILVCEDSSIVLNHETGMTDYFATTIELLPPDEK